MANVHASFKLHYETLYPSKSVNITRHVWLIMGKIWLTTISVYQMKLSSLNLERMLFVSDVATVCDIDSHLLNIISVKWINLSYVCCRYRTTWRTLSSTSIRPRINLSSSIWRWALSWPLLLEEATLCHIPMPKASRWPPFQSWGMDICPLLVTAAIPTALLPCLQWQIMTARWVDLKRKLLNIHIAEYMELKLN